MSATPSTGRSITDAVLLQLGARGLGMIASVVTIALTTRHLGVAGYGLLTTAVVFVALWSSLTELGIGAVIVRRVSAGADDLAELVGVNLGLSLIYGVPLVVVAGATGLVVYHGRPAVHAVLLVVCLSLLLSSVGTCFNPVFMATMRFGAVALADVAARLASLVATLVVIGAGGGLVWFGVAQLVPAAVQLTLMGFGARRLGRVRVHLDWRRARSLIRESLPQTGVLIVGVLYWRADALILTLLGTVREVGVYGLAYTVAFTVSVLSSFYLASSLSTMTARFVDDRAAFARFVASGMEAMLFLGAPVAVLGGILARPLIRLLASSQFAGPGAVPLTVLLVCVALTFLNGVLGQALFSADDQHFLLRLNVVNLVLNIALNVALIPPFGATGAAVALLASELSGLLVTSRRLRTRCPYRTPWPFALRLLAPLAVGAVVALLARPLPVLVALAAAGLAYLGTSLLLGPVRLSTLAELRGGPAGAAA